MKLIKIFNKIGKLNSNQSTTYDLVVKDEEGNEYLTKDIKIDTKTKKGIIIIEKPNIIPKIDNINVKIGDKVKIIDDKEILYNELEKYYKQYKFLYVLGLEDIGVVVGKQNGSVKMCIPYERIRNLKVVNKKDL